MKLAPSRASLFGSLFKSFAKVKKPDQKFIDMKENIDKFEDNLNIVEKLYSRIGKRQQGKQGEREKKRKCCQLCVF